MSYELGKKLAKDLKSFDGIESAWYLRYALAFLLGYAAYYIAIYAEPVKTGAIWATYAWIAILSIAAAAYAYEASITIISIAGIVWLCSMAISMPPIPLAIIIGALIIAYSINQRQ